MKLSEAIRGGADYADIHGCTISADGGSCCAVGGALLSHLVKLHGPKPMAWSGEVLYQACVKRFRLLAEIFPVALKLVVCPVCNDEHPDIEDFADKGVPGRAIECLFEFHGWSKKAIAEWVETIEKKLETEQAPGPRLGEPNAVRTEACDNGMEKYTPAEVSLTD